MRNRLASIHLIHWSNTPNISLFHYNKIIFGFASIPVLPIFMTNSLQI
jgi:hypothetical protein